MNTSDMYTEDYYESQVAILHRNTRFHLHRISILRKLVRPGGGEKILDLGCGIGTVSMEFSRDGSRMIGLDYSKVGVSIAHRLASGVGASDIHFVCGDGTMLPFVDGTFDKVVCAALVEHMRKPTYLQMLNECSRVLKPNGVLMIYTPCPTHIFEILKKRNLVLKQAESHVDLKDMDYLKHTLESASYIIQEQYFEVSFIPIWNRLETILMFSPIGRLFRRRICIAALRQAD